MVFNPETREKWILSFLFAKGKRKLNESVYGRTRLMKELFLADQRIRKKGEETDMDFKPDKFGPSDTQILIALEELKDSGLVHVTPKAYVSELSLTGAGIRRARKEGKNLSNITIGSLRRIKREYNMEPQELLLKYVYENYPEFTTKSEIKPWILGNNRMLTSGEMEIEFDKESFLEEVSDILDMRKVGRSLAEGTHIYSISTLKPSNVYHKIELSDLNGDLNDSERAQIKSGYVYHEILYNKPSSLVTIVLERLFDSSTKIEVSIRPKKDKSTIHRIVES